MSQNNSDVLRTLKAIEQGGGGAKTDGGTFTPGSDTAIPVEGVYESSPTTVSDGKYGVVGIDANRNVKTTLATGIASTLDSISAKLATDAIMNGNTELVPKYAPIAASSSGNNTIVAAVTGKKIRVLEFALSFSGSVNAKFQSGAGGTDLTGLFYGAANTQVPGTFSSVGKFEADSATLLNLNLSGATAVGGYVVYIEV